MKKIQIIEYTKDGKPVRMQFKSESFCLSTLRAMMGKGEADLERFIVSEEEVNASDVINSVALEGLTNELIKLLDLDACRTLSLRDLTIIQQRLDKMKSVVDVLSDHAHEPKE